MAEINVVPYIDVMLVLLVIFMITAPLLSQGVDVELPKADAKPMEKNSEEPLIVSLDARGDYYLNVGGKDEEAVSGDELRQRVEIVLRRQPQTQVMVRGDTAVDYGRVVELMVLLQKAGAPSVGIMTAPPENLPKR
ncbi:MAG: protein TolR [Pseudomonadota bacterium]|nr:protein TolR [Pseudomonadota bacterium]